MSTTIDSLQIQIQSSSTSAATGIKDLASALAELKKSGALTTVTKNLKGLADALNAFTPVASNASKINSIATSLEKLKSVGSITALTKGVKELPNAFKGLSAIGDVGSIANKLQGLSTALAPLSSIKTSGFNSAISSLSKISDVTKALDDNTISEFTSKVKKLSDALGPLSQKLTSVKSGLNGFTKAADQSGKEAKELGLNVGALNFDALTNNIQTVINALNQFAMAMKEAIAQAIEWDGISSRFGRGFGEQSQEMYAWVQRLNEELGINIQLFMQHSSIFANMLTGFGVANEDASKMALGYMELTYDIWAGYNDIYKTFEEAAEAVRSAIAGEVEPVRRAGFTIVEATLQMTAANYGITKSVETMTEAEKSYLRYLTLIDQAYAQNLVGTYAKELQTAEGMMRTAKQQLKSLTQAFGSLFLPILVKVMPYVQAFVTLLTELVHIVAGLFGIEIQKVDWSSYNEGSSAIGGVEESANGATGALGSAAKAAKELKNATLGMDELNVISPPTANGGAGGAGGTGIGSEFAGLDVDSLWDESIFKGLNNQVDEIVKKMREWLGITDDIDTWAELMDTRLGTILKSVGAIAATVATIKIGAGIAKFVANIKELFAAFKNSAFLATVVKLFKDLGGHITKMVAGIKEAGGVWQALRTALQQSGTKLGWIGLIILAVVSAVDFLVKNWKEFTKAVKEFWKENVIPKLEKIKKQFDGLKKAFKDIKKTLQPMLDKAKPILDWLGEALGKVFEFLGGVVVSSTVGATMGLLMSLLEWVEGIVQGLKGAFEIVGGIIDFVAALLDGKGGKTIDDALKKIWTGITNTFGGLYKATIGPIVEWFNGVVNWFKKLWDVLVGHSIVPDTVNAIVEWFTSLPSKIWGSIEKFATGIIDRFKDMWNKLSNWWNNSKAKLKEYTPSIGDIKAKLSTAWNNAKNWWDKTKGVLSTYTPSIGDIKEELSATWNSITTFFQNTWQNIQDGASRGWNNIKAVFSNVATWFWNNVISPIRNTFSEAWDYIENKVADMWASIKNIFSGVGTWFWNNVISPIRNAFSEAWTFIKNNAGTSWEDVKSAFGKGGDFIKNILISAWDTAKKWWDKNVKLSIPTLNFKVTYSNSGLNAVQKAIVKTLGLSGWPKLSFAANGGMFEQGSMIWAGERGAEIVANASGGKTGVMNVQQMYQAVYDATYSAMVATRQSQPQQSGGSYNLYIDGKQVTTTVEKTQKNRGATIFGTEVYGY